MHLRKMASGLLVGTVFTTAAWGADMAVKAPIIAPAVPLVTWTGFSLFGYAGWGSIDGNTDYTGTDNFSQNFLATAQARGFPLGYGSSASGFVGGGGGEYDYQLGQVVFGLRADYTYFGQNSQNAVTVALNRNQSVTVTNKIGLTGIATARGVIGWSPIPDLLVYANAGPAWAQATQELIVNTNPAALFGVDQPFNADTWGWVVGGGARYLFDPHWFAQIEGNFFDLTNFSNDNTILGNLNYRKVTSLTATDVTIGVGYKF